MSRNLVVKSEYLSDPSAGAVAPNPRKPKPYVWPSVRKQTGRRYGPAPKPAPKHRPASATPMSDARREEVYTRDSGFTRPQLRQYLRMGARSVYREYREGNR